MKEYPNIILQVIVCWFVFIVAFSVSVLYFKGMEIIVGLAGGIIFVLGGIYTILIRYNYERGLKKR